MDQKLNNTKIYVSINGKDSNNGTELSPFSTIERAMLEIKNLNEKEKNFVKIIIREGTYYLKHTLSFNTKNLGLNDTQISFEAYPGEKPVISGGKQIIGYWCQYRDGIMMCKLHTTEGDQLDFTQLFINGKRQIRARYPKYDPSEPGRSGFIRPADVALEWPCTEFNYDPETFTKKKWARPYEAEVHIFGASYWGNLQWKVKEIDWNTYSIKLGKGGFQINDIMQGKDATGINNRSRYYIENVFEELNSPGEWYLDKEEGILYIMPPKDIDLNTALIEVPILKQVIEFKGKQSKPMKNLTLSGFRIAHTTSTYFEEYEAPSLGDWTIHRGGSILFEGTEDCSVENCFFDSVGGNAVFINNYNKRVKVFNNTITEAGESGVCIVGSKHLTLGSNHAYPAECIVSNNSIHDIGQFGKQTAGVFISVSENNVISHNHIYNLPRAAVCINDGTWGGHIIEYNDIHDTVRETGDHGPFNSWGRDRFWCLQQSHGPASHEAGNVKLDARNTTIIRNNRFKDNKGWGIDLDDGSSNYHVCNNLCIGISVKLREGDFRLIENNIFINGANPPGIHIGYENNHDRFIRNIIVMDSKHDNPEEDIDFKKGKSEGKLYEIIGPPMAGHWLKELDYNLIFNDIGEFKATVHFRPLGSMSKDYTLDEWKELGLDINSIFADPMFVNYENEDFRLRPDSPAYKIGFKEFDMSKYGLIESFRTFTP